MQQIDSNTFNPDSLSYIDSSQIIEKPIENISLFQGHLFPVQSFESTPIIHDSTDTFFYWLLGISLLILTAKILFYKQFTLSILSNFSKRSYSQLQQLGSTIRHPLNVVLLIAFILSSALFFSIVIYDDYIDKEVFSANQIILINSAIISGILITSLILAEIFKYAFQIENLISLYYSSILQSYNIIAIGITMGMWFIIFSGLQLSIIIISVILFLLYLQRFYNLLINIQMKNKYSLLHYIIYLCTIEIIPLIIVTKLYFIMVLEV